MAKKMSVSIDEWMYQDMIVRRPEGMSESARVRELLTKGFQTERNRGPGNV